MFAPQLEHRPVADIEAFLKQNEEKDLLRLSTAGSVDDGKSTLIGRLLVDSKGVYEDQIASAHRVSKNNTAGVLDFSLLTDGLRAEREQGITIDVAYRYFSTPKRKFIIADTPGHEQYTRNMATGASTSNLAIILVDARNGLMPQSRRHASIASLLGIQHLVVAVNKMDLVGYSEAVYEEIRSAFNEYASRLQVPDVHCIPISALRGDNVVEKSGRIPWFEGSSLLHYLETVHIASDRNLTEFRFPVQYVLRPNADFRGYAGVVASGIVKPGDPVMVLPSGRTSRIQSIVTYDGELAQAFPPMSVTLCLEDELDISRGDMLVPPSHPPHVSRHIDARLVWMHEQKLELGRRYRLKHTTQTLEAAVQTVRYRFNVNTLEKETTSTLDLNEFGAVVIETQKPLFHDPYRRNRATGSFVLIDPVTNATIAAGMITGREPIAAAESVPVDRFSAGLHRITRFEQQSKAGHRPATIWMEVRPDLVHLLERMLFDADYRVHAVAAAGAESSLADVARALNDAGMIVIVSAAGCDAALRERVRTAAGPDYFIHLEENGLPLGNEAAAAHIRASLEEQGLISRFSPLP